VPVLITDKGALSAETAATIAYVGASHVIIAGGEAGVPAEVAASLKALPGITDVKRVAGDTAVDTAIKANAEAASAGNVSDTAILATSAYFADALSVAPYAYAKGAPIYLASADGSMTPETAAALANYKNIKIVGGTASVSKDTEAALKATASVERWAGDDAYQTSADIASKAVASGVLSFGKTSVATGKSYYDALCASAAAGSKKSAVLLVDEGEAASYGITNVITTNKADIKAVDFLGGNASVTPATKSAIQAILG
ncbi:MAG: cell wall-binding repeat-containing protein, partial [Angelakisella sp.]